MARLLRPGRDGTEPSRTRTQGKAPFLRPGRDGTEPSRTRTQRGAPRLGDVRLE